MVTMTLRMNEQDAELVRKYAKFEGMSVSDFFREAVFEKIEDAEDLAALRQAMAEDDGRRFTMAQVREELGL